MTALERGFMEHAKKHGVVLDASPTATWRLLLGFIDQFYRSYR